MLEWLAARRKAILTFVGTLLTGLAVVVTGNETLADVTTAEWLSVVAGVLTSTLLVERIPNKQQGASNDGSNPPPV